MFRYAFLQVFATTDNPATAQIEILSKELVTLANPTMIEGYVQELAGAPHVAHDGDGIEGTYLYNEGFFIVYSLVQADYRGFITA